MKNRPVMVLLLLVLAVGTLTADFKSQQMSYPRVREAYRKKSSILRKKLAEAGLTLKGLILYLRVFKQEMRMEVWGRNDARARMKLIGSYPICAASGGIGPKRKQGDMQVPEGFYTIDRFNPWSNFHLSLGLNYPNHSDRLLAKGGNPGGDIFIHGSCVTIGCIPITDMWIREVYLLCVEARNGGQNSIPVHIFPLRLTPENHRRLCGIYFQKEDWLGLWNDLKTAYDRFAETGVPGRIRFLANGRHRVE